MAAAGGGSFSSRLIKRLVKEISALSEESQAVGIKIHVPNMEDGSSLVHTPWKAIMKGPPDTPYEGCVYEINVTIPAEYPHQPPTMMFVNQCWHPNIGVNGHVCIDILKREWSPTLSVLKILLSVQSMLDDPDPTSPLNGEAATMFVNARAGRSWEAYKRTVRKSAQIRYSLSPQLANFDPDQKVLLTGPDAWK
jgi:ubiquitin-protein ligase